MKIDRIGTSPAFSSRVRYVHGAKYGATLFEDNYKSGMEGFQRFVNKLQNNGDNSTMVFLSSLGNVKDVFSQALVGIGGYFASAINMTDEEFHNPFIAKDGRFEVPVKPAECYKKYYKYAGDRHLNFFSENGFQRLYKPDGFYALDDNRIRKLAIYVAREADDGIHVGLSSADFDQSDEFALYKYHAALRKSELTEPVSQHIDERLNKYILSKDDSNVTLIYEPSSNYLYKQEKFINFVEWLNDKLKNAKADSFEWINGNLKTVKRNLHVVIKPSPTDHWDDHKSFNYIDFIFSYINENKNMIKQLTSKQRWLGEEFDTDKITSLLESDTNRFSCLNTECDIPNIFKSNV